jgi:F-type H+-transporting ATPase subunit epsilon
MALHVELVPPARLVRSDDVHTLAVPGSVRVVGQREGHAPNKSTIRDGALKVYRTDGGTPEEIRIIGGFAEVSANGLTVLAEHVEG